jgi:rhodanese-related sulfurtransferase
MSPLQDRIRITAALLIVIGGWIPAAVYWQFVARIPSVTPEEAKELLADNHVATALVDVRAPAEFEESHLAAAENWPYAQIAALGSSNSVPKQLEGKRLLLICRSGVLSSIAAGKLRERAVPEVLNVQGGMQNWVASGEQACASGLCHLKPAAGDSSGLPFRDSSLAEQWGAVVTGFVVKPLYTFLAFVLVVWLWRQKAADLAALRWAMLFFFVGENCCAANYLICNDRSILFEYLHSFGMVVCFALTTYALAEGIDRRLVKFSDVERKCAALGLCSRCIKYADAPCGFHRAFLFLIPAMMVICFMPLAAELLPLSYNTEILGSFYNYSHPVVHQVFETRYLPAAALVLLAISWSVLKFKGSDPVQWSKVFFAAGVGAIGFSLFRLILLHVYSDHMAWFGFWEEVTELLFVLGAGVVLWIFRQGLFSVDEETTTATEGEHCSSGE